MISKFNTSGLMIIVAAGLAIGATSKSVTHADKAFDSIGTSEDPGMFTQYGQLDTYPSPERYSVSFDPAAKQQLGEQTYNEVEMFYQTTQRAIETKNTEVLMSQYSNNYRNGDLDKASVAQAWQKIFAKVDNLASVNNMTLVSISADRNMVVLQSSGLLAGVPDGKRWPVTVDNWNRQDHILIKEAGEWKLIGIYGQEQKRLWFDKPMHPLI